MQKSRKTKSDGVMWLFAAIGILIGAMLVRISPQLIAPFQEFIETIAPIATSSTSTTSISTAKPLPVSKYTLDHTKRVGLGVYLEDALAHEFASVQQFEDLIAHKLEYVLLFRAWGDTDSYFPREIFPYLKSLNLTPVFTWEPWQRNFEDPAKQQPQYSLDTIIDGRHDGYIRSWAQAAAQERHSIIIRFGHEMTTKPGTRVWYPWQGEPKKYQQAFRHVVRIFRQEGASNVKFLWNPIYFTDIDDVMPYYPGDEYVDLIGFTIINIGDLTGLKNEDYNWHSCHELFDLQFNSTRTVQKPVLIVEMLSSEFGGNKANWYKECFIEIQQRKDIIGAISYQKAGEVRWSLTPIDWRVNSSKSSYEAFLQSISASHIK